MTPWPMMMYMSYQKIHWNRKEKKLMILKNIVMRYVTGAAYKSCIKQCTICPNKINVLSHRFLAFQSTFILKAPLIQEHDALSSLDNATTVNNQTLTGKQ